MKEDTPDKYSKYTTGLEFVEIVFNRCILLNSRAASCSMVLIISNDNIGKVIHPGIQ
jgi:hypothetical protein